MLYEISPHTLGTEPARLQADLVRKGAERTRTAVLHVRTDLYKTGRTAGNDHGGRGGVPVVAR